MQLYLIRNTDSGLLLGVYPGSSEADAYRRMLEDDAGALASSLEAFREEALAAQDMRAVAVLGGRYSVLESESADVDGPPCFVVHDEAYEDAVCYFSSRAEAEAEAARLNAEAACEVMLAGRQDVGIAPLVGHWIALGEGEDRDYGRVVATDEEGATVAWHGSETRTRCPVERLTFARFYHYRADAAYDAGAL